MTGYDLLSQTLEALGIDCVFGLPGSQNVAFFEALRKSELRVVVPTDELAAAFMAIGLSRVSGKVGVITTIPGPGLTYAITGLAEARLDSVPLICIVQLPADSPGSRFQLQAINQAAIVGPLVKQVFRLDAVSELPAVMETAHACALEDEPGPVLIEVNHAALAAEVTQASHHPVRRSGRVPHNAPPEALEAVLERLALAQKPMLLVGQGGSGAATGIRELAERLTCPVLTTTSGRGVLAEDHPLAIPSDLCGVNDLNALIAESDLVLALGIKFSYNGAHGFELQIPQTKLIHVDASADVLGANYAPALGIRGDVPNFVSQVVQRFSDGPSRESTWTTEEVSGWRVRVRAGCLGAVEPRVRGADPPTPERFFTLIREVLPREACLVTDSGWHQMLARRYYRVLHPSGLVLPTNLQSMGFGLPAAIGAKLAAPDRPVVAVLGDGGFLMAGMELVTAVREGVSLPVIVLNDGRYGLIRIQQLRDYGREHGVDSSGLDLEAFAAAVGVRFVSANDDIRGPLSSALTSSGPTLIEVAVGDSTGVQRIRAAGLVRSAGRQLGGRRFRRWFRKEN